MRFIDLSLPLEDSPSEALPVRITRESHEASAAYLSRLYGAAPADLPGGYGWATDEITASVHAGTHIDAPWHAYPTSGGRPARTIDQVPLDWFLSPGVVLDLRHKEPGGLIVAADLERALAAIRYTIQPRDIVLIRTGADKHWGATDYYLAGAGMSAEATRWLIDCGVRVMGIDANSWDQPYWAARQRYLRTGDAAALWEAHRVAREHEFCTIERLAHLDQLPRPFGFTVACFPVKVARGSAAWARVVAMVDE
jgi:kynurenine formamidase